jgi:hypothetical protein
MTEIELLRVVYLLGAQLAKMVKIEAKTAKIEAIYRLGADNTYERARVLRRFLLRRLTRFLRHFARILS